MCETLGNGGGEPPRMKADVAAPPPVDNNVCMLCNESFFSKRRVSEHVREVHGIARPFSCEICRARFPYASSLYNHSRIHSDNRPFKCSLCTAAFRWKNSLKHHKAFIHKERGNKIEMVVKQLRMVASQSQKVVKCSAGSSGAGTSSGSNSGHDVGTAATAATKSGAQHQRQYVSGAACGCGLASSSSQTKAVAAGFKNNRRGSSFSSGGRSRYGRLVSIAPKPSSVASLPSSSATATVAAMSAGSLAARTTADNGAGVSGALRTVTGLGPGLGLGGGALGGGGTQALATGADGKSPRLSPGTSFLISLVSGTSSTTCSQLTTDDGAPASLMTAVQELDGASGTGARGAGAPAGSGAGGEPGAVGHATTDQDFGHGWAVDVGAASASGSSVAADGFATSTEAASAAGPFHVANIDVKPSSFAVAVEDDDDDDSTKGQHRRRTVSSPSTVAASIVTSSPLLPSSATDVKPRSAGASLYSHGNDRRQLQQGADQEVDPEAAAAAANGTARRQSLSGAGMPCSCNELLKRLEGLESSFMLFKSSVDERLNALEEAVALAVAVDVDAVTPPTSTGGA